MNSVEKLEQINSIAGKVVDVAKGSSMDKTDPVAYYRIVSNYKKIVAETEELKKLYKGV